MPAKFKLGLEAPLSAFFGKDGNPVSRTGEARKSNRNGKKRTEIRYWYVGPGCAVWMSALFLLERLAEAEGSCTIQLYEGFVSFKGKEKSSHKRDAKALRDAVRGGKCFEIPSAKGAARHVSILEFVNCQTGLPPIIFAG